MRSYEISRRFIILFLLCFLNSGYYAQILDLFEGESCPKGNEDSTNYICRRIDDCKSVGQEIGHNTIPQICSFNRSTVIVCCPTMEQTTITTTSPATTTTNTLTIFKPRPPVAGKMRVADKMCQQYSQLIYSHIRDPVLINQNNQSIKVKNCIDVLTLIVNGTKAEPKEFPHMALIGYSYERPDNSMWACGGSLISDKWILTAAHCEKISSSAYASWARLGELNYLTDTDNTIHQDYRIEQRIIHPNYRPTRSLYNDIALFRLEKDVKFSAYVRPICLNTDHLLKPTAAIATGWGQTESGGPFSPDLLKVILNTIPANICNASYPSSVGTKLPNGILDDSMICAGFLKGGKDTCGGDSGGPFQIKNYAYTCMYTQIGVTSFGKICADKNSPGVYTKVSKYITWIENIVWPKM